MGERRTAACGSRCVRDVVFHDGTPARRRSSPPKRLNDAIERPANRALYPSLSDITAVRPDGELELVVRPVAAVCACCPEDLDCPLGHRSRPRRNRCVPSRKTRSPRVCARAFRSLLPGRAHESHESSFEPFDTLQNSVDQPPSRRSRHGLPTCLPDAVEFVQNDDVQMVSVRAAIPVPDRVQFAAGRRSRRPPCGGR